MMFLVKCSVLVMGWCMVCSISSSVVISISVMSVSVSVNFIVIVWFCVC